MKNTFELSIPSDWSEITTKQYLNYINSVTEDDTDEDNMAKILLYFCNVKQSVVKHFKVKDLNAINKTLINLINKPLNKNLIHKIEMDGVKYGFHPKLDEMTMGEFVDLDTYAKDGNLSKMMGVLYRPITKEDGNRYDIETYSLNIHGKNYLKFQNLSVNIANGVSVFFWTLGISLLKDSQVSLTEKALVG